MSCPQAQHCGFFQLLSAADDLGHWRRLYCEDRYQNCVRHQRLREGKPAPIALLPNGTIMNAERARAEARRGVAAGAEPAANGSSGAAPGEAQSEAASPRSVQSMEETASSYCLRMRVKDQLGAVEGIKSILRDFGIGVDAVVQKPLSTGAGMCMLVLLTDQAPAAAVQQAVQRIEELGAVDNVRHVVLGPYD